MTDTKFDDDLKHMKAAALTAEVSRLRAAIRAHRAARMDAPPVDTGAARDDRAYQTRSRDLDDAKLYRLLPENTPPADQYAAYDCYDDDGYEDYAGKNFRGAGDRYGMNQTSFSWKSS